MLLFAVSSQQIISVVRFPRAERTLKGSKKYEKKYDLTYDQRFGSCDQSYSLWLKMYDHSGRRQTFSRFCELGCVDHIMIFRCIFFYSRRMNTGGCVFF